MRLCLLDVAVSVMKISCERETLAVVVFNGILLETVRRMVKKEKYLRVVVLILRNGTRETRDFMFMLGDTARRAATCGFMYVLLSRDGIG